MTRTAALLAAMLFPLPLLAQEPAGEKEPALSAEELARRQAEVGERLRKIEDTMTRVAKVLANRNPELAARLRMAWQRSQADRNLEKIEEIENLLKEEYLNRANEEQRELEAALHRLLDILLDRDAERKEVEEQIERLESLSERLNKLIEEERDQYLESEKFASPEKALQNAAAAKARLANLIERQGRLADRTRTPSADADLDALRERLEKLQQTQRDLRGKGDAEGQAAAAEQAGRLAQDVGKYAQRMPDEMKGRGPAQRNPADQAAAALERAAAAMRAAAAGMQGGQSFEGRQSDAEQELREAREALRRLEERRKGYEQQRLKADQERIRKDAERLAEELDRLERSAPGTDSGSGDLRQAQGKMQEAEQSLGRGARGEALPHEEAAKRDLERAKEKLEAFEKELKRLLKLPDYEKLAEKQDDTAEKTDDLLKKMRQAGGGQEGEPAPGEGGVEGAKKAMQRASRNLRSRSAKSANKDQKEALDRLEKAREELEEALRQLREEEQLMLLDALERRFARMLQKQTRYFKETISLNIRLRESKRALRADVDKARQLSEGETGLAGEAEKVLEILREEGTTVVIPDVVADLRGDLDTIAARLAEVDAGAYTQRIQSDVIETLKELIVVIQEERERKQGGGEGGEPQEGEPPESLLPTSAELKMLKSLQVRVNRRTSEFERLREKDEGERRRLAGKQDSVGELTRTMADKLNRQEDE